jgi:hypothetical protein
MMTCSSTGMMAIRSIGMMTCSPEEDPGAELEIQEAL